MLKGANDPVRSLEREQSGLISVVICTYGRATALFDLLASLQSQTYRPLEILIVDGNEEPSPARETVERFLNAAGTQVEVRVIKSKKGLTRQRNVGLQVAKGELICFLDDDVTFSNGFFSKVAHIFGRSDMQDVGGITAYDLLNYPMRMSARWYLRWLLGVMPGRDPGRVDHLGRAVPISFLKPWSGHKDVGWLPGFCMIYRRAVLEGLLFDEYLSTYGGEDRDFSMRVGQRRRLLICGDLHIQHHYTVEGRDDDLDRMRQCSFGAGRRFAKYSRSAGDYFTIARVVLGDFAIDTIALLRWPPGINFSILKVRLQGLAAGWRSVRASHGKRESSLNEFPARQPAVGSGNE